MTTRYDLKCGNGSVSPGEKCTKGSAGTIQQKTGKRSVPKASLKENLLKYGGVAGTIGSVAYLARPSANVYGGLGALNASLGVRALGQSLEGKRTKNKTKQYMSQAAAIGHFGTAGINAYIGHKTSKFNQQYEKTKAAYGGRPGYNSSNQQQSQSRPLKPNQAVKDPFKDLEVKHNASDDEIKRAWKQAMATHHPDRGGDPEKAKSINVAYQEILRRRARKDSVFADGFIFNMEDLWL